MIENLEVSDCPFVAHCTLPFPTPLMDLRSCIHVKEGQLWDSWLFMVFFLCTTGCPSLVLWCGFSLSEDLFLNLVDKFFLNFWHLSLSLWSSWILFLNQGIVHMSCNIITPGKKKILSTFSFGNVKASKKWSSQLEEAEGVALGLFPAQKNYYKQCSIMQFTRDQWNSLLSKNIGGAKL